MVKRRLETVVRQRMGVEPVIVLQGARAVGKSTLLREVAAAFEREVVDLDDPATRESVHSDPDLFLRGASPILIDEFQHLPQTLDTIKSELNRDTRPGRFILAGSTRYASLPYTAQSLTGRVHRINILPLSQGEVEGIEEDFAAVLMNDPSLLVTSSPSTTTRHQYVERVVAGGFPMALLRDSGAERARWFDDYLTLVLERDVLDLSRIRQRRLLPLLLLQLAGQTSCVLNVGRIAERLGMERSTAENYTKLLEAVFLVQLLPAWGVTLGSRVAVAPKLHLVDSGLTAHLLRLSENKLALASASALTEFGHLLETFAINEVCKQLD